MLWKVAGRAGLDIVPRVGGMRPVVCVRRADRRERSLGLVWGARVMDMSVMIIVMSTTRMLVWT